MTTLQLALLGNPVKHSLSPAIHKLFAQQFGISLNYELISCTAEQFTAALGKLQQSGAAGCNITLPLKNLACELADELSDAANKAGAANTIIFKQAGICADNTDGEGWLTDLQNTGGEIKQQSVCLLGAGGAAAGIIDKILDSKPTKLIIANRDKSKAESLLSHTNETNYKSISMDELANTSSKFDLVINATSLGHQGLLPALSAKAFSPNALYYDLNYGQAAQPILNWCKLNSINYQDGLGMLVEQAARSFYLWTGKTPSTSAVLTELRAKLD